MSFPRIQIPPFQTSTKRILEIPYQQTIIAGATLTLCSSAITFPFKVLQIKMIFLDEANNWIRHSWYLCDTPQSQGSGMPAGVSLFRDTGQQHGFIGKGIERVVYCNTANLEGTGYIALYTESNSPYNYPINCSAILMEI